MSAGLPILNAEELVERHRQFISEVGRAVHHCATLESTRALMLQAQRRYAEWMVERGVLLDFTAPVPKEPG